MSVTILGHRVESSSMGPHLVEIEKREFDQASWENQIASSFELRQDCTNLSVDFSQRKIVILRCTLNSQRLLGLSKVRPSDLGQNALLVRIVKASFALSQITTGSSHLVSLILSVNKDHPVCIEVATNDERVDNFESQAQEVAETEDDEEYESLMDELRYLQAELKQELCGPRLAST